jgi:hypothetical protein
VLLIRRHVTYAQLLANDLFGVLPDNSLINSDQTLVFSMEMAGGHKIDNMYL